LVGVTSQATGNDISFDTLPGWIKKREDLKPALANNEVESQMARFFAGPQHMQTWKSVDFIEINIVHYS
jgi:hypothetical protein